MSGFASSRNISYFLACCCRFNVCFGQNRASFQIRTCQKHASVQSCENLGATGTPFFKRPSDVCHFRLDGPARPPNFQRFAFVRYALRFKIQSLFGRLWVLQDNFSSTVHRKESFVIFVHSSPKQRSSFLTSVLISRNPVQKPKNLPHRTQMSQNA